jgi:hypothetical protein
MPSVQHADLTSIHRFAAVASSDPGAIGAYKGWVDTSTTPFQLRIRNSGNTGWNDIGSIYTGANIGTGVGLFKQVSSGQFQFKKLEGGASGSIVVANHPTDVDSVGIDVIPAGITLSSLSGTLPFSSVTMDTAHILGRTTAGTGAVQQITVGNGLSLASGVLSATSSAGFVGLNSDFNVSTSWATFLEVLGLGGGSIWSIDAYFPFSAANAHPHFTITTTASLNNYIADWEFVSTAHNTAGATPTIRTCRSTSITDVMDVGTLDGTVGYVRIKATIDVNVNGKISFQTEYASIIATTTVILRGANVLLNRLS